MWRSSLGSTWRRSVLLSTRSALLNQGYAAPLPCGGAVRVQQNHAVAAARSLLRQLEQILRSPLLTRTNRRQDLRRSPKSTKAEKAASSGDGSSKNEPSESKDDDEGPFKFDLEKIMRKMEEEERKRAESSGDQDDKDNDLEKRMKRAGKIFLIVVGIVLALRVMSSYGLEPFPSVNWTEFQNKLLPSGQISKIQVIPEEEKAYVHVSTGQTLPRIYVLRLPNVGRFEAEVRAAEIAFNIPPEKWVRVDFKRADDSIAMPLLVIAFWGALAFVAFMLVKGVKSFNVFESVHSVMKHSMKIYDPKSASSKLTTKFKDVAGLHEAKAEIVEFVDYLKNPQRFTKLGARLPKGALLTGPPGCGKTLLAKALAAESSSPFISVNGTEFIEMIGGMGASRVRALFKKAKTMAPCIIYMDEIDAIGRKRGGTEAMDNTSGEAEQTLNQLLVEMDGMDSDQGIIMIASTNRPEILDKALLRPGRFDRHISVDLPTVLERKELFELYLKRIKLKDAPSYLSERLAQMTPGFSGADIANAVNESAIHAATNQKKFVTIQDIDHALGKILAGPEKRSKTLVKEEREVVAYHESGHALVGWLLEHTDALLKVTIIPRTSAALGFAQYTPKDRKLFTKEELFDRMCMMLGGRAAENVTFGRITTGAQNDLEKVTKQAYAQVQRYGMSNELGPLSFSPQPGEERQAQFMKKPYSKKLQQLMDTEARRLVAQAYYSTEQLLKDNNDKLEKIAKALLAKETLTYEDVKRLIGPPKYGDKHVIELVKQVLPDDE